MESLRAPYRGNLSTSLDRRGYSFGALWPLFWTRESPLKVGELEVWES